MVFLILFEHALEAFPIEIVQYPLFFLAVTHLPEKHAIFILLQSKGAMAFVDTIIAQEHSSIISIILHKLFLVPFRVGLLALKMLQVNFPL